MTLWLEAMTVGPTCARLSRWTFENGHDTLVAVVVQTPSQAPAHRARLELVLARAVLEGYALRRGSRTARLRRGLRLARRRLARQPLAPHDVARLDPGVAALAADDHGAVVALLGPLLLHTARALDQPNPSPPGALPRGLLAPGEPAPRWFAHAARADGGLLVAGVPLPAVSGAIDLRRLAALDPEAARSELQAQLGPDVAGIWLCWRPRPPGCPPQRGRRGAAARAGIALRRLGAVTARVLRALLPEREPEATRPPRRR